MRVAPLRPGPVVRRLFLLGSLAALCGCQKEEDVRHYAAPKEQPLPAMAESGDGSTRLLGAIVPQGEGLWVFKLMGPDAAIKPHEAEFEAFVESVKFKGGDKPDFKAPEGWRESEGTKLNGQRLSVAAFRVGPEADAPELTVTRAGGSLADNVNRWRNQLSLKPVDEAELKQIVKEKKIGAATAALVNMTGTAAAGGMRRGPFAGAGSKPPSLTRRPPPANAGGAAPKLKYTLPSGWEEGGELIKNGIARVVVFQVRDGSRSAEVAVTIAGGDLKANINRWRGQVNLEPADDFKDVKSVMVDGNPSAYVDLSGDGRPDHKGILGAIVRRGREDWFIKLDGPADIAAKQKTAFEAFLKSVRFEGGDAHE
jgi:hypothetical protein